MPDDSQSHLTSVQVYAYVFHWCQIDGDDLTAEMSGKTVKGARTYVMDHSISQNDVKLICKRVLRSLRRVPDLLDLIVMLLGSTTCCRHGLIVERQIDGLHPHVVIVVIALRCFVYKR